MGHDETKDIIILEHLVKIISQNYVVYWPWYIISEILEIFYLYHSHLRHPSSIKNIYIGDDYTNCVIDQQPALGYYTLLIGNVII